MDSETAAPEPAVPSPPTEPQERTFKFPTAFTIAAIGSIGDTAALVRGQAGTIVTLEAAGVETAGAR